MSAEAIAPVTAAPAAIQKPPRQPLAFLPANLDDAWRISEMLAKSGILPDALKGRPHDILVTVMTGTELGLSPMAAIRDIYVVKGKGYMSALLKVSLVKQSPECEYFRCIESTDKKAVFETKRRNEGITKFEYTIDDAIRADLVGKSKKAEAGKDNWEKNPKLMMRRRCSSELCDEVYPDVVRGIGNRDDVQETAVNSAPSTFAPPPPEPEEAQVVAPTPPRTAKTELPAETVADVMGQQIDEREKHLAQPAAEKPAQTPVSQMKTDEKSPMSPLEILAAVEALDPTDPKTEGALDLLSPLAKSMQGIERSAIGKAFQDKRAAVNAHRAGGK